MNKTYILSLTYNPKQIYPEMDEKNAVKLIDNEIINICGKENKIGSGMMLDVLERDIQFEYETEEIAKSKEKDIELKYGDLVIKDVYDFQDEDEDIFK